jgi:hypothetical protein
MLSSWFVISVSFASIRGVDGDEHGFLCGGKDDGGAGAGDSELILQLFGEKMIEILGAAAADLEEVVIVAGDVVTLGNLFHLGDGAKKSGTVAVAGERDGDIGGKRVAYGRGIYESGVAADDATLFKLADAVSGGRGGEAEELAEFGPGGATASHQELQSLRIQGFQRSSVTKRWN